MESADSKMLDIYHCFEIVQEIDDVTVEEGGRKCWDKIGWRRLCDLDVERDCFELLGKLA